MFFITLKKEICQLHLWFAVMLIVVPLLSLVAHVPDAWVGVLGGVSRTAASIIYGCVTSPSLSWLMWMGEIYSEYCIYVWFSVPLFKIMYC